MFWSLCLMLILFTSVYGRSASNKGSYLHRSQREVFIEELSVPDTIQGGRRDYSGVHPNCTGHVGKSICESSCSDAGLCADDDLWVPVAKCTALPETMCANGECVPGAKEEDCQSSKEGTGPEHEWRPDGRAWTCAHNTDTKLPIFSGAHPNCSGLTGTFVCDDTCKAYGVCIRDGTWVPVGNCAATPNKICRDGQCVQGKPTDCATHVHNEGRAVEDVPMKSVPVSRNCSGLVGQYICDETCTTKGICSSEDVWVPVTICTAYPDTICHNGQCILGDLEDCPSPEEQEEASGRSFTIPLSIGGTGFNGSHPDCHDHLMEYICEPNCEATGICVAGKLSWVDTEICDIVPGRVCVKGLCVPGTADMCQTK